MITSAPVRKNREWTTLSPFFYGSQLYDEKDQISVPFAVDFVVYIKNEETMTV